MTVSPLGTFAWRSCAWQRDRDSPENANGGNQERSVYIVAEKGKKAAYTNSTLILHFLEGSLHFFLLGILCSFIGQIFQLIIPRVIGSAVDRIGLAGTGSPLVSAAYIVGLALISRIFSYFRVFLIEKGGQGMMRSMRTELFEHIEHLPYAWQQENSTGDIIQRCTNDTDRINQFVSNQLVNLIRSVALIGLSFFFMFRMNIRLAFYAFLAVPVIILYSLFFHRRIGSRFQECDEEEGVLSTIAQENLTGILVVRAFGREEYEQERFDQQNEIYTASWVRLIRLMSFFWGSGDLLSGLQVLIVLSAGSVLCVRGEISTGVLIAFLSYNSLMIWPIRMLGRVISELSKAGVSIERIAYILNSPPEMSVREKASIQNSPDSPGSPGRVTGGDAPENKTGSPASDPDFSGDIVYRDVSFSYDRSPVVREISFTIPGGSTFGILGETGSGKSTLMLLLDRMMDLQEGEGEITIGGIDIRDIPILELRKNIGMVLQEPFLFARTIGENIGISQKRPSLDQIRRASRIAAFDKSVLEFDKGYDTMVGERGVTLSGGQKQRAAIARMLTQNPPIMVFDDSLSAVDAETDLEIRRALQSATSRRTVILISHRVSTLAAADRILVMEKGRAAEIGSPRELYDLGGIYRRVWDLQEEPESKRG